MPHVLAAGDDGMSCLAVPALRSDSPLPTTECLQVTPSFSSSSNWDRPVYSAATFPGTVSSQFKLDLKERATTNEMKCEPGQKGTLKLFPILLASSLAEVTYCNFNKSLPCPSHLKRRGGASKCFLWVSALNYALKRWILSTKTSQKNFSCAKKWLSRSSVLTAQYIQNCANMFYLSANLITGVAMNEYIKFTGTFKFMFGDRDTKHLLWGFELKQFGSHCSRCINLPWNFFLGVEEKKPL